MANLIDEDYFVRDITIPNLNTPANLAALNSDIESYQREVLVNVLGYKLYSLFINDPTSEQRFLDIKNGKEFEFLFKGTRVKRKYIGLSNAEHISLIAYYTYFFAVRNRATYTSGIGEVIVQGQNSINASNAPKLRNAWNKYVDLSGHVYCDLNANAYFDTLNPENYTHVNDVGSLFNFLLANKDVYPEWEFTPERKINIFGI